HRRRHRREGSQQPPGLRRRAARDSSRPAGARDLAAAACPDRAALAGALRHGSAQPPARSPHQPGQPARSGPARLPANPRPDPAASRGKVARLTPRGLDAQRLYHELTGEIERRWRDGFTPAVTAALRASLEPLAAGQPPPLFGGLEPYPDNWRAVARRPDVL